MGRTFYRNARILTGKDGIIENGVLVVGHAQKDFAQPAQGEKPVKTAPSVSDRIEFLGTEEELKEYGNPAAEGDEEIDCLGNTVMPGLVCADTRLDTLAPAADDYVDNIGIAMRTFISLRSAAEALNAGVTTLRAEGMPNNIDIALKNAVAKTMFFGPSVLATGPVYGVTGGKGHEKYGMVQADGVDALRGEMRIRISRGLEGIVLQVSGDRLPTLGGEYRMEMSRAEIGALVKHANGAEKPVAVNASGDPSVSAALDAGVACIQQGYRIGEENLVRMAESGTAYVPCLVSTEGTDIHDEHMAAAAAAVKAGVRIAAGTEILPSEPVSGTTAVIRELELLCEAGMTPADALKAATVTAAEVCGAKGAGVLKAGGKADFLIVGGKPDEDISAMRGILAVVKDGRRAFSVLGGAKERAFHIHAPGYEVAGGTTFDWTEGTVRGIRAPENFNTKWNLVKEI